MNAVGYDRDRIEEYKADLDLYGFVVIEDLMARLIKTSPDPLEVGMNPLLSERRAAWTADAASGLLMR